MTDPAGRSQRFAALMLVIATLCWGMGFAWAKNLGEAFNTAAGMPKGSVLGPNAALATRFGAATILWILLVPASRRGWTWGTVWRGGLIGGVLSASIIVQHLGLDLASEATVAFLTNLTVVFVPLMLAAVLLRLPKIQLIAALPFAMAGIWLLTGARADGGLDVGEWFAIACALGFSVQILLMNWLIPQDSPARITVMMFAMVAVASTVVSVASPGVSRIDWGQLVASPAVVGQWLVMVLLVTLVAFGLMNTYQPRVDPTRAAIVYLLEPIFAALFAWLTEPDGGMTHRALMGAGLILIANGIAELKWPREQHAAPLPPV